MYNNVARAEIEPHLSVSHTMLPRTQCLTHGALYTRNTPLRQEWKHATFKLVSSGAEESEAAIIPPHHLKR